jgi:hypothetical protein
MNEKTAGTWEFVIPNRRVRCTPKTIMQSIQITHTKGRVRLLCRSELFLYSKMDFHPPRYKPQAPSGGENRRLRFFCESYNTNVKFPAVIFGSGGIAIWTWSSVVNSRTGRSSTDERCSIQVS